MKKLSVFVIIFFAVLGVQGCKNQELMNQWKPDSLIIDGSDEDWQNVPLFMEEDLNVSIASANDNENEFLILKTGDQRLAGRIFRMGITIWVSTEGKKDKKFGIRYVGSEALAENLRRQATFGDQQSGRSGFSRMRDIKRADLPQPGMIGVIRNGKYHVEPEKSPWGPSAASQEVNGLFCYEFKIPLRFSQSVTDEGKGENSDKIKIGIEIGGVTQEMRQAMREKMGGMSGQMRGGRMGGSRGGMGKGAGMGRGGGGQRPGMSDPENKEFWFDLFLSEK